ncbi:MAG: TonB-dependent receptor [Rikenellaceae bacterium]|nr:TonB-dependent receptor [Rikenellaceae bacterium]
MKKYERLVKTAALIALFSSAHSLPAQPTAHTITVSFTNLPLGEAIRRFENLSSYTFVYDANKIDVRQTVSLSVQNMAAEAAIAQLFRNTGVDFSFIRNNVVLTPARVQGVSAGGAAVSISGRVVNEKGEPVMGATVWLKETSASRTTDVEGRYTIDVSSVPNPALSVSFFGYNTVEEASGGRTTIDFTLHPSVGEIEDVVVVGYGTQRRESVVGSITTIAPKEFRLPTANISTVLAGQLGGVVSVHRSGEPGSSASFWIRGISTMNNDSNKPLVLVDGIERSLDLVDVEDIENFSVLKDATATAIYGVRGANGVILITTRSGESGAPRISVRAETGVTSPTRLPKMADAVQFARLYNEAAGYTSDALPYSEERIEMIRSGVDPDLYPNVDWIGTLFRNIANNQRINTNVSGGGSIARYFISGSYYHEGSIFKEDNTKRYDTSISYDKFNFRSNVDVNLTPTTVVNVNLSNIYETRVSPNADRATIWERAFIATPALYPARYSDGTLAAISGGGQNPYNLLTQSGFKNEYWNNAQALLGLTKDFGRMITPGLKANVKFSWDAVTTQTQNYSATPNTFNASGRDDEGNLVFTPVTENGSDVLGYSKSSGGSKTFYLEGSLSWARAFGRHNLGALFLYNQKSMRYLQAGDIFGSAPYRNQGVAGRLTYGYNDRYFVEGNFGYNGSENFSPGRRFGLFPSIAVGWMVSSEGFWQPLREVVDKLKFRASYGLVGNDKIGQNSRFVYDGNYENYSNAYWFGQQVTAYNGTRISAYGSPNVSWEKSHKLNAGLELSLFRRVDIQADYFRDYRTGIFLKRDDMTDVAGVLDLPYANIGEVLNRGFEVQLQSHHYAGELQISTRGNFTYNRNKILRNAQPTPEYPYMSRIGLPVDQQTGYIALGLFSSQEEIDNSPAQFGTLRVGDVKYKDVNGDGVINAYDVVPIGRTWMPEITFGIGASMQWRNFDLSFLFQGVANTTIMLKGASLQTFSAPSASAYGFYEDVYYNIWTLDNPNPNAIYPRASTVSNNNNYQNSTLWQRDISYVRLKNASIGYRLPQSFTRGRLKIQDVHLYLQGVNLLTFTGFKLFDPEIDDQQGAKYPPVRVISFGLNINF